MLICHCFHKGHYTMNCLIDKVSIRCKWWPSQNISSHLELLVFCFQNGQLAGVQLHQRWVCSKLLGPKWPVLIDWFKTVVINNNPFKNSHYEVCDLVSCLQIINRAYYHNLTWLHVTLVFDPCTICAISHIEMVVKGILFLLWSHVHCNCGIRWSSGASNEWKNGSWMCTQSMAYICLAWFQKYMQLAQWNIDIWGVPTNT